MILCCLPVLLSSTADYGKAAPVIDANELSGADRVYLAQNRTIRICVDPHWMPLEGIDRSGQHVGVIADILAIIAERLSVHFELVPTQDYSQSLAAIAAGECDVLTSDTVEGERPSHLRRTSPSFLDLRNVYITRNDEPMQLSFRDIKHRTIAIPSGYPTIPLIRQTYGDVNIVEVATVDDGLIRVSKGEIYAFTDFLPVCSYAISRLGLSNLKVAGHLDVSFPTSMAVRADKPELFRIMNYALSTIDERTLNELLVKWLHVEYDVKVDWREIRPFVVLFLLFGSYFLYSNARLKRANQKLDEANAELKRLTKTDPLTKLRNRYFLDNVLPDLVTLPSRQRRGLGVALIDLDHFKLINDRYGHAAGDRCLATFADVLRSNFKRESDWLIRYGGEEFLVVCAGVCAEDFRAALEACRIQADTGPVALPSGELVSYRVSIGYLFYAQNPPHWSETIIMAADRQLYRAKSAGRNRVVGEER